VKSKSSRDIEQRTKEKHRREETAAPFPGINDALFAPFMMFAASTSFVITFFNIVYGIPP
jgi:hypothetical protein